MSAQKKSMRWWVAGSIAVLLLNPNYAQDAKIKKDNSTLKILHFDEGDQPGKFGKAIYVHPDSSPGVSFANEWGDKLDEGTVEMWIKPVLKQRPKHGMAILFQSYGIWFQAGNFYFWEKDKSAPSGIGYQIPDYWLEDKEWHHVAATWNSASGEIIIYLDGWPEVSRTGAPFTFRGHGSSFLVGGDADAGYSDCYFDEFRLSNRVLTRREIMKDYLAKEPFK